MKYKDARNKREASERQHVRVMVVSGVTGGLAGGVLGAIFADQASAGFVLGLNAFIPAALVNNFMDWFPKKIAPISESVTDYMATMSLRGLFEGEATEPPLVYENAAEKIFDRVLASVRVDPAHE